MGVTDIFRGQHKRAACIVLGAAALLLSFLGEYFSYLVWVPVVVCGIPIVTGALGALARDRDITADLLVSTAIIASLVIGEFEAAAEISVIMQIGSFLEEATVNHANSCLERLASLKPHNARLIQDGRTVFVGIDEVVPGQTLRVFPGETIPADGRVSSGTTSVDTSMITGEPVPRDVSPGDEISAGMVNMHGSIEMTVDRPAAESTVSRMENLIRQADAGKARIVRVADRWASYIVVLALAISVLTFVITGDIVRSVTVLVVFCPCALVLATPTAIMAASAKLTRHGILVKDGGALERLARVGYVVMDKTGTLTTGTMQCRGFVSTSEFSPEDISRLAASAESLSEHPIGRAIADSYQDILDPYDFEYVPGMGVTAAVGGHVVSVGNRRFASEKASSGLKELDRELSVCRSEGYTCVCVCIDGVAAGFAMLSDTLRPTSEYTVRHLRMLGLKRVMLTGDAEAPARKACTELAMDDVVWECLPSDKLRIVTNMDGTGGVCMVGDGVNDAPSLKRASVGICVYGANNDLAMESSDIVLMEDDLTRVPGVIRMARRTLATIHAGILFSVVINVAATVLAVTGLIGPVGGALVHNIGSVAVITAAAMLLRFDPWKPGRHRRTASGAVQPRRA